MLTPGERPDCICWCECCPKVNGIEVLPSPEADHYRAHSEVTDGQGEAVTGFDAGADLSPNLRLAGAFARGVARRSQPPLPKPGGQRPARLANTWWSRTAGGWLSAHEWHILAGCQRFTGKYRHRAVNKPANNNISLGVHLEKSLKSWATTSGMPLYGSMGFRM